MNQITKSTKMDLSQLEQKPSTVQVTHGVSSNAFDVAGRTVRYVRESLGTLYSIPKDALALVNGDQASEDHLLQAGDELDFLRPSGSKGLGRLLTPEQLIEEWPITREQYLYLLDQGLPKEVFPDGAVIHHEYVVDDWFRNRNSSSFAPSGQPTATSVPLSVDEDAWCHAESEPIPAKYEHGPLVGNQRQLATWLSPDGKDDPRPLKKRARNRSIWVRKLDYRTYHVYFQQKSELDQAVQRKLRNEYPEGSEWA